MNVAANAFIAKTGGTLDDFYDNIPKHPHPELEHDWDFEDDDELKKRYPKLYKKFGG